MFIKGVQKYLLRCWFGFVRYIHWMFSVRYLLRTIASVFIILHRLQVLSTLFSTPASWHLFASEA